MPADWRIDFLGDSALLLRSADEDAMRANARVHALADRLRDARVSGVGDIVPGMRDLVVHVDPLRCNLDALTELIAAPPTETTTALDRETTNDDVVLEVPVTYGRDAGPDLLDVARTCGLSPDEVCRRHAAVEYRVCFVGFLPGFPYLGPVDTRLRMPRRATPRPKVPPGSVAIAGEYSGIYPWASPGGWHLIGRTDVRLFDPERDPPALLAPGARVRFVPA